MTGVYKYYVQKDIFIFGDRRIGTTGSSSCSATNIAILAVHARYHALVLENDFAIVPVIFNVFIRFCKKIASFRIYKT